MFQKTSALKEIKKEIHLLFFGEEGGVLALTLFMSLLVPCSYLLASFVIRRFLGIQYELSPKFPLFLEKYGKELPVLKEAVMPAYLGQTIWA